MYVTYTLDLIPATVNKPFPLSPMFSLILKLLLGSGSGQPKNVVGNGHQRKGRFVAGKGRPLPVVMVVSKMNKDAQMRAAINHKLIETGER